MIGPVMTSSGAVCGKTIEVAGASAWTFQGIPYAESPAGMNRWTPPTPKAPWQGNMQAIQFGPICPQPNPPPIVPAPNEDCLSVNVWTPEGATSTSALPVMVFIYGGSYLTGSSALPVYDGTYLAGTENVVIVTFNYRVGALGFLGGVFGLKGNYGFLDQQLALQWVQSNIMNFGGDPTHVTIFGESAGAMSVGLHLLSAPMSENLFVAAMMESNPFALPYKDPTAAGQIGTQFAQSLMCADLRCLLAADVGAIIQAETNPLLELSVVQGGFEDLLVWAPIVDGTVITKQPIESVRQDGFRKPTLLGTNHDEGTLFVYSLVAQLAPITGKTTLDAATYEFVLLALFTGSNLNPILQLYPADPVDSAPIASQVLTDYLFFCANRFAASKGGPDVYAYEFNQVSNFNIWPDVPQCAGMVCHGDELPYVFNSATLFGGMFTPPEELLSQAMVAYWADFSRPGHDPNRSGKNPVRWPRFTGENYLLLNTPISTAIDPPHNCDFWDTIGYDIMPAVLPGVQPPSVP